MCKITVTKKDNSVVEYNDINEFFKAHIGHVYAFIGKHKSHEEQLKKAYKLKEELETRLNGVLKDIEGMEAKQKEV